MKYSMIDKLKKANNIQRIIYVITVLLQATLITLCFMVDGEKSELIPIVCIAVALLYMVSSMVLEEDHE